LKTRRELSAAAGTGPLEGASGFREAAGQSSRPRRQRQVRLPIPVSRPRRRAQAPFVRRIGSRVRGQGKVPCGRLVSGRPLLGRPVSGQGRAGDQATLSVIVPIASSCWLLPGVLRLMARSRRVPRQWPASSGPGWGGAGIGKIRLGIGRLGTDRWGEIGESRIREFGGASRSIPP